MGAVTEPQENFRQPGTLTSQFLVGAQVDVSTIVANVLAPTALFTPIVGTGLVKTITPPWPAFSGVIYLVNLATAVLTWDATGNITLASAAAPSVGKVVGFAYLPTTAKWYPFSTVAA